MVFPNLKLIEGNPINGNYFSSTDDKTTLEKNLKSQPEDWYWRSKKVYYTLNSQLYRAPEWNQCEWNNSVLVFGCSFVYGVGVNDDQTIPYFLSQHINQPVINLGQPAAGIGLIWANSIILRSKNINPKAVVFCWPDTSRQTEFLSEYEIDSHGAWGAASKWTHLIQHEEHNKEYYKYMTTNLKLLWKCPIIEVTYYEHIKEMLNCPLLHTLDKARDLLHPGVNSLGYASKLIAERLNNSR